MVHPSRSVLPRRRRSHRRSDLMRRRRLLPRLPAAEYLDMSSRRGSASALVSVVLSFALATPALAGHEFVAEAGDFKCLTDGVRAPRLSFYISHKHKAALKKAVAKTTRGKLGKGYPVGTILQLLPFEAMVKRGGKFNRAGHGWEYFKISVVDGQTQITARGGVEVANFIGSCQGCHENLAAAHDAVCEFVVGASGLGLTAEQLAALQASDPRCTK